MDEIKKLLKQNEDFLMIYSDESDSDNESSNVNKYIGRDSILKVFDIEITENNLGSKKRTGKERLPTRRPDPNVYNRNALLARENRRKKKMYLETIEKELQLARKANRALLKILKQQIKIRRQLEEEKNYFNRLFAERSERASKSPSTSETQVNKSLSLSSSFESLNFLNTPEECEMTSCSSSIFGGETESGCIDRTSDDLENEATSLQTPPLIWDDIWINNGTNIDNFNKQDSTNAPINNVLRDVNNDHCYFTNLSGLNMREENSINDGSLNTSEICSHHIHGEFLEIYCPTCINPECRAPPLQLLDDKL